MKVRAGPAITAWLVERATTSLGSGSLPCVTQIYVGPETPGGIVHWFKGKAVAAVELPVNN
jgi:hypothetical protein